MIKWLNRQNRRHSALYNKSYKLFLLDDNTQWYEPFLFNYGEKLNKRGSKISSRRSSKKIKLQDKFDSIFDNEDLIKLLSDLEDDNT